MTKKKEKSKQKSSKKEDLSALSLEELAKMKNEKKKQLEELAKMKNEKKKQLEELKEKIPPKIVHTPAWKRMRKYVLAHPEDVGNADKIIRECIRNPENEDLSPITFSIQYQKLKDIINDLRPLPEEKLSK